MVAIPDRLEHRIGEARVEQVLYRLLAEEVVDAEDILFREIFPQHLVEFFGRCAIVAERFFDHQPRILCGAGFRDPRRHGGEQAGRHRQIIQRAHGLAEFAL